jgi:hypothetical protein
MLLGEGVDSAYAATDYHTDAVGINTSGFEASLAASLLSGYRGELGKPIHAPGFFSVQVIFRVEAFNLGREVSVEAFGVEGGDEVHSRAAVDDSIPCCGYVQAKRAYDPHTCN